MWILFHFMVSYKSCRLFPQVLSFPPPPLLDWIIWNNPRGHGWFRIWGGHNISNCMILNSKYSGGFLVAAGPSATPPDPGPWDQGRRRVARVGAIRQPWWLNGVAPPSALDVILETWDQVPRRAPCMEPASPSAFLPLSFSLSVMNK